MKKIIMAFILLAGVAASSGFAQESGKYVVQNAVIETISLGADDEQKGKTMRTALLKIETTTGRVWEWSDSWQEGMSSMEHVRKWEELVDHRSAKAGTTPS
jgi:hypothetical protein